MFSPKSFPPTKLRRRTCSRKVEFRCASAVVECVERRKLCSVGKVFSLYADSRFVFCCRLEFRRVLERKRCGRHSQRVVMARCARNMAESCISDIEPCGGGVCTINADIYREIWRGKF